MSQESGSCASCLSCLSVLLVFRLKTSEQNGITEVLFKKTGTLMFRSAYSSFTLRLVFLSTLIPMLATHHLEATAPPYPAATHNQQQVANQLQSITNPTEVQQKILNLFNGATVEETQRMLGAMSGEQYTTLFTSMEIINRQFIRRLYDPLRPLISNPCSYEDDVYELCSAKGIKAWAEGTVNRSFLDGTENAPGFKMSGYELSGGAFKRLDPVWTLGFGLCYAIDHFHYNIGGSGKTNTVLGALYALYRPAHYYALVDLVFGYANNDMHRKIAIIENEDPKPENSVDSILLGHSKPNVSDVSFYGELGVDWDCSCVLIQPFIGLEAGQLKRDCKVEHHSLDVDLNLSGKTMTSAYSRVGVHFTTPENCYDLFFALDLAWQYRLTSFKNDLKAKFVNYGDAFIITGIPVERNSASMAFTVWSEIFDGWTLYLQASGERWKRVSNYDITGGLIFKW